MWKQGIKLICKIGYSSWFDNYTNMECSGPKRNEIVIFEGYHPIDNDYIFLKGYNGLDSLGRECYNKYEFEPVKYQESAIGELLSTIVEEKSDVEVKETIYN